MFLELRGFKMFSDKTLLGLEISNEDWIKPLNDLDKDVLYRVGSFNHGNVATMIYFKDGIFYSSNKAGIQKLLDYNFNDLSRAYEYFEELFYKDCL